jgi:pimeloyl-ACP methyl ester carboxylesterase
VNSSANLALILLLAITLSGCSTYYPAQAQAKPHYVAVPHGRIEYYRIGQGSPIVMIAGYATDVSSWNRQFLAALASQHQLIIINNRNVAGSRMEGGDYDSHDCADDVYRVIKALHLKKPAVLGISMGGMIAQQVAVMYPDSVGRLILINTAIAGHEGVHPSPEMEKRMLNIPNNKLGFYAIAIDSFFPTTWKARMAYSLAADRFQPDNYNEIDFTTVAPQQRELLKRWGTDDLTAKKLGHLKMPVLILNGEADIVIPPINSSILAKKIPHATLVRWKQGGHAMIYQFPDAIAQTINNQGSV